MKLYHLIIFVVFCISTSFSQNGIPVNTFNPNQLGFGIGDGAKDGYIRKVIKQSDGKMIVIGSHMSYNNYTTPGYSFQQFYINRILPNGRIDSTFNFSSGFNTGPLNDALIQPDGKIIIVGNFTSFNGVSKNRIVRLNSNGTLDNSFNVGTGFNAYVSKIQLQTDGKIIALGGFSQYNGLNRNSIVRINANGTIDNTFIVGTGIPTFNISMDIKIQTDGKILVCGEIQQYNGTAVNRIFRLTTTGAIDNSFSIGTGPNSRVNTILLQPDGKIVLSGSFSSFNSVIKNNLIRLLPDGSIDGTFISPASGIIGNIYDTSLDNLKRIYLSGTITSFNGTTVSNLARVDSTGVIDISLNAQFDQYTFGALTLSDNSYIPYGLFIRCNSSFHSGIVKLLDTDIIDSNFNPNTGSNGEVKVFCSAPNNKYYVGGSIKGYNGAFVNDVIRIDENGALDPSFNPSILNGYGSLIYDIKVDQNGKVLVGGSIYPVSSAAQYFYRLNSDGSNDLTFNIGSGFNASVLGIAIQSDNKIIACGGFSTYNSVAANCIIRLNSDGTIDNSFATGSGFDNYVYGVKILSNGKILAYGDFSSYNGITCNKLALLNADGTLDNNFNVSMGPNGGIRTIHVMANGSILVGGTFTTWNGIPKGNIVQLSSAGTLANSIQFGIGFDGEVLDIEEQSNGKLIISGGFSTFNSFPADNIIRIYSNGFIDNETFSTVNFTNNLDYVNDILLMDTNMLIGGNFISINGVGINRITAGQNCVAATSIQNLVVCDSLQWINGVTYYSNYNGIRASTLTANGCDSIVYLNLIVKHSTSSYDFKQECPGYVWPITGQTYDTSGLYTGIIPNSVGCDSLITLVLTILPHQEVYDTLSACDSLLWIINNTFLYTSGDYVDTISNIYGCDSIVHLNLTINTSYHDTINVSSCEPYFWSESNVTYINSGFYSMNFTAVNGCDSILTLNFTRFQSDSISFQISTCDSAFLWTENNVNYTLSGVYTDTLTNVYGCDSILYLHLSLLQNSIPNVVNQFVWNTDLDSCNGVCALNLSGNSPYILSDGSEMYVLNSNYFVLDSLCQGPLNIHVTDFCLDSLNYTIYIPSDTSFIFNNPTSTNIPLDSLGTQFENCFLDYGNIDTAFIDSAWANGNNINVVWNLTTTSGILLDTSTYLVNSGPGIYWLQLTLYCPFKSVPNYFTVTEALYWDNGTISTAGIAGKSRSDGLIFPNPFNDELTIVYPGSFRARIYDLSGKELISFTGVDVQKINLGELSNGAYFIIFEDLQNRSIHKIIKQ